MIIISSLHFRSSRKVWNLRPNIVLSLYWYKSRRMLFNSVEIFQCKIKYWSWYQPSLQKHYQWYGLIIIIALSIGIMIFPKKAMTGLRYYFTNHVRVPCHYPKVLENVSSPVNITLVTCLTSLQFQLCWAVHGQFKLITLIDKIKNPIYDQIAYENMKRKEGKSKQIWQ